MVKNVSLSSTSFHLPLPSSLPPLKHTAKPDLPDVLQPDLE